MFDASHKKHESLSIQLLILLFLVLWNSHPVESAVYYFLALSCFDSLSCDISSRKRKKFHIHIKLYYLTTCRCGKILHHSNIHIMMNETLTSAFSNIIYCIMLTVTGIVIYPSLGVSGYMEGLWISLIILLCVLTYNL